MDFKRNLAVLVLALSALSSCGYTDGNAGGPVFTLGFGYSANTSSSDVSIFQGGVSSKILAKIGTFSSLSSPTAVAIGSRGPYLFVANSGSATVSSFQISTTDGSLTKLSDAASGAGTVALAFVGGFVYSADNTANTISIFQVSGGILTNVGSTAAVGTLPQGLAGDPSGRFLFVASEGSNQLTSYAVNGSTGALTKVNSAATANLPTGVVVDPVSNFVFVSAASGNISVFQYDGSGTLTFLNSHAVGSGSGDTNAVAIDSSGRFVYAANPQDNTVSICSVDGSGNLTDLGTQTVLDHPVALTVDVYGSNLFVVQAGTSNTVGQYKIGGSGGLTLMSNQSAGLKPQGFAILYKAQPR